MGLWENKTEYILTGMIGFNHLSRRGLFFLLYFFAERRPETSEK